MVTCKHCKGVVSGWNYYLLKKAGKIIAHFCSSRCLMLWSIAFFKSEQEEKTTQSVLVV